VIPTRHHQAIISIGWQSGLVFKTSVKVVNVTMKIWWLCGDKAKNNAMSTSWHDGNNGNNNCNDAQWLQQQWQECNNNSLATLTAAMMMMTIMAWRLQQHDYDDSNDDNFGIRTAIVTMMAWHCSNHGVAIVAMSLWWCNCNNDGAQTAALQWSWQ